jgi:hypothetical protein
MFFIVRGVLRDIGLEARKSFVRRVRTCSTGTVRAAAADVAYLGTG